MATKTAAGKTAAPRKARPAARKSVKAKTPTATPAPATQPRPRRTPALKAPSPIKVVKTVAKAIEASPVGKAGAVTSAVLRSRRAAQLSRRVRNKHVVVTGASSGIGLDCALKLGAAGATVMLAARTPSKLQETVERIRADGGKAFAYACDLSDMADCDRFIQTVLDEHGHVDILINNAGRSIRRSVKASFDRFHDFERTMQLNYFGALRLIMGFLPKMIERRRGHIINISSIGVLSNAPRFSAYVASKSALDSFSACAASEFLDKGIHFTTINMPLVRTPMIAPTKIYESVPTLSPEEAADLVVDAILHRPVRIATRLGIFGAVSHAIAPKLTQVLLNSAFNMFPDSSAAAGKKGGEPKPLTPEQMAFAQITQGIHW
jgi:NAD(P)-dependent dehydrogenase (short-subunit alcohol dehydrogenase family)